MEENGEQSGAMCASSSETAKSSKCITDNTLPEELISNILVRLPVKSLIRFTIVCKSWMSTIKDPSFIRAHLTRIRKSSDDRNASHLCLVHNVMKYKGSVLSLRHDINYYCPYRKLEFPRIMTRHCRVRVHDTCNGLVLLSNNYLGKLFVWNPSISKYLNLLVPSTEWLVCGLGYDDVTKDYKVVKLINNPVGEKPATLAQVYSLAKGYWRELHSELLESVVLTACPMGQARVNGVLLWLVCWKYTRYSVLTFDVSSESFGQMGVPNDVGFEQVRESRLSYSGDGKSIALFVTRQREKALDIWVMQEFGVEDSWTKVMVLGPWGPERRLHKALCFRRNGEVLLVLESNRALVSLDLVSKRLSHLGISGGVDYSVHFFEESLELLVPDPCTALSL